MGVLAHLCSPCYLHVSKKGHAVSTEVAEFRHLPLNFPETLLALNSRLGGDQIQLIQHGLVCESNMLVSFVHFALLGPIIWTFHEVLGVCKSYDTT